MTHTYTVTGMTCKGCEATVKSKLLALPDVLSALVSKDAATAVIVSNRRLSVNDLQLGLGGESSKYQINAVEVIDNTQQVDSWILTYKPIIMILVYLVAVTGLIQVGTSSFDLMLGMRHFMAGFFLIFSFFKLLNLKGFAESYAMYDVVAKKWQGWGYIFPFIEAALGLCYLTNYMPFYTNLFMVGITTISTVGVLTAIIKGGKIQCACLGAVFNLPMSTVTLLENSLMIVMGGLMLIWM